MPPPGRVLDRAGPRIIICAGTGRRDIVSPQKEVTGARQAHRE